jgi:hypothetical protein
MRKAFKQTVVLPAPAHELFAMYLDPVQHAAITGAPVNIRPLPDTSYDAFGGLIWGTMLQVIEPSLIVHSCRTMRFDRSDPDMIVIWSFTPAGTDGRIDIIYLDLPDQEREGTANRLEKNYWKPWRAYLKARAAKAPPVTTPAIRCAETT